MNNTLEVFVSTDFDGSNVTGATWDKINVPFLVKKFHGMHFKMLDWLMFLVTQATYILLLSTLDLETTPLDGGYFVDDVLFLKQ